MCQTKIIIEKVVELVRQWRVYPVYLIKYRQIFFFNLLDGVAPFVANPPSANSDNFDTHLLSDVGDPFINLRSSFKDKFRKVIVRNLFN